MKQPFESSKIFTAYATIDAGYYMIEALNKSLPNRSGIEKAIDSATGYDKFCNDKLAKQLIPLLEDIIEAKKTIEADFSKDEEMLKVAKQSIIK